MLTRVQICKQYGITSATFDAVKPLLMAEPQPKFGNVFYELSSEDDLVLHCAKNHNASFSAGGKTNIHTFPFHRFLALRFLTTPLDEIYDELQHRNLITSRLKKEYLRQVRTSFFHNLPPDLKSIAIKQEPPGNQLAPRYKLMMQTLGIDLVYEQPLWMEMALDFVGDQSIKRMVEVIFTTRGSKMDHQQALEEMTRYQWSGIGVELYRSVFYDISPMSDGDWAFYGQHLRPPERNEKLSSRDMTTNELCVHAGNRPHFKETMEMFMVNLQRHIGDLVNLGIDNDTKELGQVLRSYMVIGKATGEELRAEAHPGKVFETVNIVSEHNDVTTIEDIQRPEVAQVKSARA